MESINLQILNSVIFSQYANPSLISYNSIIILEEQHFVLVEVLSEPYQVNC